jgi:nicotinate phosphoribosyltransferase
VSAERPHVLPLGAPALLTDLYQLTMLQAYYEHGLTDTAVFEFFVRKLPKDRGFLMAAGLEQVLDYLEGLRFTPPELDWMRSCGRFSQEFVDRMADFHFTGDVHAMPEGTVFFPDEPILRVTAPLPEAQLVETRVINLLHFQSVIASKACRMVLAAPDKRLVDFGLRRAHGAEAGLLAARAGHIAGLTGTATVEAERAFGIPIFGTMAHSFIEAHDDEMSAFEHFARSHPDNVVLLIDTYDTEAGARKVVRLGAKLAKSGIRIQGVRIDSGDLIDHARKVRTILDEGGLADAIIFASGSIDEHLLAACEADGAPIDGYGIGTRLDTSADAPSLDCAYKLQEYAGSPRRKRSEGKATWPGRKQVFRTLAADGVIDHDTLAAYDDAPVGDPLIVPVLRAGARLSPSPPLAEVRARAAAALKSLPPGARRLTAPEPVPVQVADSIKALAAQADRAAG